MQELQHTQHRRVIILGAGFAGVYTARTLARQLPEAADCEITLVDENNYFLFTPMLTEVVGGEVDEHHIATSIRALSPRVSYVQGRVAEIDLARKTVTIIVGDTGIGIPEARETLAADHLVIALGSVTNYHHIPGLREHSLPMKALSDGASIHSQAVALLERANTEPDPRIRREMLTFVVGGGGFSGVETMAALNSFVRSVAGRYLNLSPDDIRTVIIHPDDRLLPELSEGLAHYTETHLRRLGVEIMLNTRIAGAGENYVEVEGGERIPTRLLVWTGGVTPSPVVAKLDCHHGKHGGITVEATCAVPGFPGVWALGDCAEVPQPHKRGNYAPTAQNATREGRQVARNIAATLRGEHPRPFVYTPIGELALVGRRSGVASVFGAQLSGFIAWVMWRVIYLAKEPRIGKRVRIALDWLLDLALGRDMTELPPKRIQTSSASRQDQSAGAGNGVQEKQAVG